VRRVGPSDWLRISLLGVLVAVPLSGLLRAVVGVDPLDHLHLLPTCGFKALLGVPCPGCGMTRALLLVGQLRVAEALVLHPLVPVLLLLLLWLAAGSPGGERLQRSGAAWALVLGVLCVWLFRLLWGTPAL
jgi:hypothetical protein